MICSIDEHSENAYFSIVKKNDVVSIIIFASDIQFLNTLTSIDEINDGTKIV